MRLLTAREIECRVQQAKGSGVSLLLYKDARCDMAILDEEFGADRWQRKHELIDGKLYCSVGIKYGDEWVWKQDVGTESNTEKEKGQASDSFKRACFNVGIGRELYTAPFIWIPAAKCDIAQNNGRWICNTRFSVASVEYNEYREIVSLTICDEKTGEIVYQYSNGGSAEAKKPAKKATFKRLDTPVVCQRCGIEIVDKTVGGRVFTARQILEEAKKRHGDDAVYCCDCMRALKDAKPDGDA